MHKCCRTACRNDNYVEYCFRNFEVIRVVESRKIEGQDKILPRGNLASLDVLINSKVLQGNGWSELTRNKIKRKEEKKRCYCSVPGSSL